MATMQRKTWLEARREVEEFRHRLAADTLRLRLVTRGEEPSKREIKDALAALDELITKVYTGGDDGSR